MAECLGSFGRRKRDDSIGVNVNDTSNEIAIANATVTPKLWKKRPMMPPMNATGRKITMRDSVVAVTARPISRVPMDAA